MTGSVVRAVLARHYPAVAAEVVTFLPRGDSSWVFLLGAGGRTRWVAKFYPADLPAAELAGVRGGAELAGSLADRLDGVRVPYVVRAVDGAPLAGAGGHRVHLQEFVPGGHRPLGDVGPAALERLGAALAQVHATIAEVPDRDPVSVPGAELPGVLAAAGGLLPSAGDVVPTLPVVRRRAADGALAAARAPWVVVHGDVVAANVLAGDGGTLALVDWDGVHRAPREYELGTITCDAPAALAAVVRGYRRGCGVRLDAALILGHAARYVLFGLEFHLRRALSAGFAGAQRRHDLGEAQRYADRCLSWRRVETSVTAALPAAGEGFR